MAQYITKDSKTQRLKSTILNRFIPWPLWMQNQLALLLFQTIQSELPMISIKVLRPCPQDAQHEIKLQIKHFHILYSKTVFLSPFFFNSFKI